MKATLGEREKGDRPPAMASAREVFEILVREHADMLVTYLRSLLRSTDAVDDLFQETMLTAWQRLDDYDRSRPFGPWLRGIARNLVARLRDRRPEVLVSCEPEVLDGLEDRFFRLARFPNEFRDLAERLETCLAQLPGRIGPAIKLVYREGFSLRKVAERLGASEEAVKKRIQRGRQILAQCLRAGEGSA